MATDTIADTFPVIKLYKPLEQQWNEEYEAADAMPAGPDRERAFHQFYKVNLPQLQRARDAFMAIPAPGLCELLIKMEFADATNDDHHDLLKRDLRLIIATAEARAA
ncbi:hypothetical protein [Parafrankia sp. BMG5.11]|uniref:hypothetical protein n=1 Tax=Parafrankia sp. BMG5.11 TaxID=222540 RepID=UPI001039037F|nr:hypothetical protein [Parafrankia sp. BMG5.11]TCJ39198.1 hypothetical protein E0504_08595 [Parafrankia sp. BMG5.11]